MTNTITLKDNGTDRYTLESSSKYFGRMYDNISEAFQVIFPAFEVENGSTCTMIVVSDNAQVDNIIVKNGITQNITDNLSQYSRVKIGFSFEKPNGYVKNSEWKYFYFYDALKPNNFVPSEPEQQKQYNLLLDEAIVDVNWKEGSNNILEFINLNGSIVKEISLSGFVQEQADLGETNPQSETFVKNKSTKYLFNDGEDGTSPYATQEFVSKNGGRIDSISIDGKVQDIDSNKNVNIVLSDYAKITYVDGVAKSLEGQNEYIGSYEGEGYTADTIQTVLSDFVQLTENRPPRGGDIVNIVNGIYSGQQWIFSGDTSTWKFYIVFENHSVINNLNSDSEIDGLAAKQGKILNDKKLDKQTPEFDSGATRGYVYFIDTQQNQIVKKVQIQANYDTIPLRNPNGNFYVGTPTLIYECTNKGYVDDIKTELEGSIEGVNTGLTVIDNRMNTLEGKIPTITATQLEDGSYSLTIE